MRIDGRHSSYEFEDDEFARGGAARLFRGAGRHTGLVYKKYLEPIRDDEPVAKVHQLVGIGRKVFTRGPVVLGGTPESSVCWPTDVECDRSGAVIGVVMPVIPDEFFRKQGKARTLSYLVLARTDPPGSSVRVSVLIRVAEIFAWLAANNLAHGDFSDANIVWRPGLQPGAVLIDADGLQPADRIADKGMKTPHWIDPRVVAGVVPAHDQLSDWYALALSMYRGLLLVPGNLDRQPDGSWPKPSHIPANFPKALRQLFDRTLGAPLDESGRAAPAEWVTALRAAYLVNDSRFDRGALTALDHAADARRPPPPTVRFQPLPAAFPQQPRVQPPPVHPPPPHRPPAAPFAPPLRPPMAPLPVTRGTTASGRVAKVSAGVVVVVALVIGLNATAKTGTTTQPGGGGGVRSTESSEQLTSSSPDTPTSDTSSRSTSTDPGIALQQQAESDAAGVEALAGQWVPQLSSKAVGTRDNGTVYDNASILDHYRTLKSSYSSVLLLRSDSFSTFKRRGFWVVVMPEPASTGQAANSWCDTHGIDANNCFAKLLSHTAGPEGATLNR
ncbi:hypothetical protein ACFVYA_10790 [Amycolatopsis sp. NPDC058278]|uniref:hypothetical protein n=1 Tax=Amycolatopsis sp. NPDC058278 TaxID=3346417 RepID=UPI0036DD4D51